MDDAVAYLNDPVVGFFAQLALSIIVLMARPTLKLLPFLMSLTVAYFTLPLYKYSQITRDLGIGLEFTGRTLEDVMIKTSVFMAMHLWALVFVEGYLLPHRETFLGRLHAAYKMIFNGRRIGTNRLAPQMPLPDGHIQAQANAQDEKPGQTEAFEDIKDPQDPKDPQEKQAVEPSPAENAPSQAQHTSEQVGKGFHDRLGYAPRENRLPFIARRLGLVFLLYVIEYILKPEFLKRVMPEYEIWYIMRMHHFFTRLHEVTLDEMALRTYLAFETAWAGYVFYTMLHSLGSVFCKSRPSLPFVPRSTR